MTESTKVQGNLTWIELKTTGTAVRKVDGSRPKKTTAVGDRYIILKVKKARKHAASDIAQQLCLWTA